MCATLICKTMHKTFGTRTKQCLRGQKIEDLQTNSRHQSHENKKPIGTPMRETNVTWWFVTLAPAMVLKSCLAYVIAPVLVPDWTEYGSRLGEQATRLAWICYHTGDMSHQTRKICYRTEEYATRLEEYVQNLNVCSRWGHRTTAHSVIYSIKSCLLQVRDNTENMKIPICSPQNGPT